MPSSRKKKPKRPRNPFAGRQRSGGGFHESGKYDKKARRNMRRETREEAEKETEEESGQTGRTES